MMTILPEMATFFNHLNVNLDSRGECDGFVVGDTGLEKSTHLLPMASTSCYRTSRNFYCFQCKLLNFTNVGLVEILTVFYPCG